VRSSIYIVMLSYFFVDRLYFFVFAPSYLTFSPIIQTQLRHFINFGDSSPFVFAYELRKILFKKKKMAGTAPSYNGATLRMDMGGDVSEGEARRSMNEIEEFEVAGLEEVGANSKISGSGNTTVVEEGPDGDIIFFLERR
jgi:hypothetical protein